ncbi:hypothetical protein [Acetobacter pasteurianus]|nr:hypothetical protein [Acetobacter pasteurianus]WKC16470.1 hypothetical protein FCN51_14545 [Acetobacter pasteurianus]GAB30790.1 hypothetical protein APS_1392 [Acetobacter pasteurianus subsp. pasteurianus LMG 1262 = NBRC 106471]
MGTASGSAHIVLPMAYKLACAVTAHTLAVQGGWQKQACVRSGFPEKAGM